MVGDIERQRQMQANQLAAQFQGARAFGGSRQAIQEAELARSAMEQGASTAATLRQQGFGQALQAAGQQAQMGARAAEFGLGQGLQAQLANQAARQRFGEFGAQQGMQAALANQAARQRFGEFAGGQSMQAQLANQAAQARAREFGLGQSMQAQLANQAAALSGSQQRYGCGFLSWLTWLTLASAWVRQYSSRWLSRCYAATAPAADHECGTSAV